MIKKTSLLICAAVAGTLCVSAQSAANKSFEEFRKGVLGRYDSFRSEVLSNYDKFLEGIWVEYDRFRAQERNPEPKPEQVPQADVKLPERPADLPAPKLNRPAVEITVPKAPAEVDMPGYRPVSKFPDVSGIPQRRPDTSVERPKDGRVKVDLPKQNVPQWADEPADGYTFDFYGMPMVMPDVDVKLMNRLAGPSDYARQWRDLAKDDNSAELVKGLTALAHKHNFNDYLTYDLARRYAAARYSAENASARTALVHYLMANMGYDIRLGATEEGAIVLLPCKQTVYGQAYLNIDGVKYYIFTDPEAPNAGKGTRISTCQLPSEASKAKRFDLALGRLLNLPYEGKAYSVKHGDLEIHGEVNARLYPMLFRYPQMPVSDYARSELMPELRADVVSQLKKQLDGKPLDQAIDALLLFVQNGFEYATDQQSHGFEKPYFFEETLFYPQCDCEDRAIFYSYLLWHVLGVENHMINYPGHESASVLFPGDRKGDSYIYEGKRFLISDPTYIGARTGMCMPNYRSVQPEIDHIYK